MRRLPRILPLLTASALIAAGISASTAATRSSYDPLSDGPAYVYSDNGAALSDDGSHYCFKNETTKAQFLAMMSQGCRTGWGMPGLRLGDIWWAFDGAKMSARSIDWHPWGWEESATVDGLKLTGRTYFTSTDVLVSTVTVTNPSGKPASFVPQIGLHGGPTYYTARDASPSTFWNASASLNQGAVQLETVSPMTAIGSTPGPTAAVYRENRVFQPNVAIKGFTFATGEGSNHLPSITYDGLATLASQTLAAHGTTTLRFVSGWARDSTPTKQVGLGVLGDGMPAAQKLTSDAVKALTGDDSNGFNAVVKSWRDYLGSLPIPADATTDARKVAAQAATALRMNWYAKINAMPGGSILPVKAFYDGFYAWDTPYNAMGYSYSDVGKAEEALETQLDAHTVTGSIPGVFGDDMQAWSHTQGPSVPVVYDDTQAPTQGLAILRILARDRDLKRKAAFVLAIRKPIDKYIGWWENYRDLNHDGLIEVGTNDDASFYTTNANDQYLWPAFTIAPTVYNAYYNLLLQAAAALAAQQKDILGEKFYMAKALASTKAMNAHMWDAKTARWHSVTSSPGGTPTYTQDPANTVDGGLIALYAANQDPKLAKAYIEHNLLDPKKFYGKYPFPTLAYDDPDYSPGGGFSGKLWLNEAEPMLELLWKYGYQHQADVAAQRLTAMLAQNPEGIYEAYNSKNGDGVRQWQFSWSSSFTLEMVLRTWQHPESAAPRLKEYPFLLA